MKAKATTGRAIKTKGKIDMLDRIEWNIMRKTFMLTDDKIFPLREAKLPAKTNEKSATLVRIFSPDTAKNKGITIEDYETLNAYPELVLYEGYQVKGRGGEFIIKKHENNGNSFLDEKIKTGVITDIGLEFEKTGKQKWLGKLGKFVLYGGWLLIIIIGLLIYILIQSLA